MLHGKHSITHQGEMFLEYNIPAHLYSVLVITCRTVLRRLQAVSGIYGMVAASDKTTLLHPVVGRFTTGATIRVVQPAEVLRTAPWVLEGNKSCGLRITTCLEEKHSVPLQLEYVGVRLFTGMSWHTPKRPSRIDMCVCFGIVYK